MELSQPGHPELELTLSGINAPRLGRRGFGGSEATPDEVALNTENFRTFFFRSFSFLTSPLHLPLVSTCARKSLAKLFRFLNRALRRRFL